MLERQHALETKLRSASSLVQRVDPTGRVHTDGPIDLDQLQRSIDTTRQTEAQLGETLSRHSTAVMAAALRSRDTFTPSDDFDGAHLFANNPASRLAFVSQPTPRSSPIDDGRLATLQSRLEQLQSEGEALRAKHADELATRSAELDRARTEAFRHAETAAESQRSASRLAETSAAAGNAELERLRQTHKQEIEDLKRRHADEVRSKDGEHSTAMRVTRSQLDSVENDLREQLQAAHASAEANLRALADAWLALPKREALEAAERGDVTRYRQALASGPSDKRRSEPPDDPAKLVEVVRQVMAASFAHLDLLARTQEDLEDARTSSSQAQRSIEEAQREAEPLRRRVQDLETQAARAQANEGALQDRVRELEAANEQAKATAAASAEAEQRAEQAETELRDLRVQLDDAQDDLDEFKNREQKQRVQLLDELNTAQSELATLRTQLRSEQRKNARGAPSPLPK